MSLKLLEVLVLLGAGALFVGWQWRDLRRAREHTRQQREAERLKSDAPPTPEEKRGPHGS